MVVFPAPDGDDKTSINPRRSILPDVSAMPNSTDILDLFAQLFDCCFKCQTDPRQLDVRRFGT